MFSELSFNDRKMGSYFKKKISNFHQSEMQWFLQASGKVPMSLEFPSTLKILCCLIHKRRHRCSKLKEKKQTCPQSIYIWLVLTWSKSLLIKVALWKTDFGITLSSVGIVTIGIWVKYGVLHLWSSVSLSVQWTVLHTAFCSTK